MLKPQSPLPVLPPATPHGDGPDDRLYRRAVMASLLFIYAVCLGVLVKVGIDLFTPCQDNFEGGCGMGKSLLLFVSLVPALVALGLAVGLGHMSAAAALLPRALPAARLVLIALPAAYLLGCFYLLTL